MISFPVSVEIIVSIKLQVTHNTFITHSSVPKVCIEMMLTALSNKLYTKKEVITALTEQVEQRWSNGGAMVEQVEQW